MPTRQRITMPDGIPMQPQATPVSTFVGSGAGTRQDDSLLRGLAQLNQGLQPFLASRMEEKTQEIIQAQQQEAERDLREKKNMEDFRQQVASGNILPGQNPHKLRHMKYLLGVANAEQYGMDLEANLFDKPFATSADIGQALGEARKKYDSQDPEVQAGLLASAAPIEQRFRAHQQAKRIQQIELAHEETQRDTVLKHLDMGSNGVAGTFSDATVQRIEAFSDEVAKREGPVGRHRHNELVADEVIKYAMAEGDERYIESFMAKATRLSSGTKAQLKAAAEQIGAQEERRLDREERRARREMSEAITKQAEQGPLAEAARIIDQGGTIDAEQSAKMTRDFIQNLPPLYRQAAAQHVQQGLRLIQSPDAALNKLRGDFVGDGGIRATLTDMHKTDPDFEINAPKYITKLANAKKLKPSEQALFEELGREEIGLLVNPARAMRERRTEEIRAEALFRDSETQQLFKAVSSIAREEISEGTLRAADVKTQLDFVRQVTRQAAKDLGTLRISDDDQDVYAGEWLRKFKSDRVDPELTGSLIAKAHAGELSKQDLDTLYLRDGHINEKTYNELSGVVLRNDATKKVLEANMLPDTEALYASYSKQYAEPRMLAAIMPIQKRIDELESQKAGLSEIESEDRGILTQKITALERERQKAVLDTSAALQNEWSTMVHQIVNESRAEYKTEPAKALEAAQKKLHERVGVLTAPAAQQAPERKKALEAQQRARAILYPEAAPVATDRWERTQQVLRERQSSPYQARTETAALLTVYDKIRTADKERTRDQAAKDLDIVIPQERGAFKSTLEKPMMKMAAVLHTIETQGSPATPEQQAEVIRLRQAAEADLDTQMYSRAVSVWRQAAKALATDDLSRITADVPAAEDVRKEAEFKERSGGSGGPSRNTPKLDRLKDWAPLMKDPSVLGLKPAEFHKLVATSLGRRPEDLPPKVSDYVRLAMYYENTVNTLRGAAGFSIDEALAKPYGDSTSISDLRIRATLEELGEAVPKIMAAYGIEDSEESRAETWKVLKRNWGKLRASLDNEEQKQ